MSDDRIIRMLSLAELKYEGSPTSDTVHEPLPPAPDLGIELGLYWVRSPKYACGQETVAKYRPQDADSDAYWLVIGSEIEERSDFFEVICPARRR